MTLWKPFNLAFQTKMARITTVSLNGLQKFIAHRVILGQQVIVKTVAKSDSESKRIVVRLIDEIVDAVCSCFSVSSPNEEIELQILKVLLTSITNDLSEVHDSSLLRAIQTIFNICIYTKNSINHSTAKATLTQTINVVFQRIEHYEKIKGPHQRTDDDERRQTVREMMEHLLDRVMDKISAIDAVKPLCRTIVENLVNSVTGSVPGK
jgi:hypothetical protein